MQEPNLPSPELVLFIPGEFFDPPQIGPATLRIGLPSGQGPEDGEWEAMRAKLDRARIWVSIWDLPVPDPQAKRIRSSCPWPEDFEKTHIRPPASLGEGQSPG